MRVARGLTTVLVVVAFIVVLAVPALAQEESPPAEPASIDLELSVPSNQDVPPQFVAVVRDPEGNAIPGVVVSFSREVEFLGTMRTAFLGSGTTDVGGTARLVVEPRQGQAIVVATVPGSDISARVDAVFPEDRVEPFFHPGHEHGLLTPLRNMMPYLIAAVVALLWIFVIGLAIFTFRRIRELGETEGGRIG